MQLGDLGRAPAALASNDLIAPLGTWLRAHEEWLQNTVFNNGGRKFL